jgi:hypothetical protein
MTEGVFPKANGDVLYASEANGLVPIGTILPWVKSLTNTPSLTGQFVECNGQTLSDADSVYNGVVIPNLNGGLSVTGTASSGANTTLTDSSKSWTINAYAGWVIKLTGGTGAGQFRQVVSNTSTAITIAGNWTTNPSSDSTYFISTAQKFLRGAPTSGGVGGEDAHLMTVGELVSHGHVLSTNTGGSIAQQYNAGTNSSGSNTASTGGSQAFSELPSYYEVVYIIRVK